MTVERSKKHETIDDTDEQTYDLFEFISECAVPLLQKVRNEAYLSFGEKDDPVSFALSSLFYLNTHLYKGVLEEFQSHIKLFPLSRAILENHATMAWILEADSKARANKYRQSGEDFIDHINYLRKNNNQIKRTRKRLPTTETLLKALRGGVFNGWYDQLNFLIHPSPALFFAGGRLMSRTSNLALTLSILVYIESIDAYNSHAMVIPQPIMAYSEEVAKKLLLISGLNNKEIKEEFGY